MITLKKKYGQYFDIGTAISNYTLKRQSELLKSEFNSITCENAMKFGEIHPKEDLYAFERADAIADFARNNGLKMRGHTLVWHNQTSQWLFEDEAGNKADKSLIYKRLEAHMSMVMKRYEDVIYAWDVVNEAIDDSHGAYLRESPWLELCGESFIEEAFRLAHKVQPKAKLFYNDYNALVPEKRDKIIRMIKSLQDNDVPIHGIGIQGHLNIYEPSIETVKESIEAYAALGLEIHVTELDVSMFRHSDGTVLERPTEEMIEQQAKYYQALFDIFMAYKQQIKSITLWGISDAYTWLNHFPYRNRKNWPLLFDDQDQKKLCYKYLLDM